MIIKYCYSGFIKWSIAKLLLYSIFYNIGNCVRSRNFTSYPTLYAPHVYLETTHISTTLELGSVIRL